VPKEEVLDAHIFYRVNQYIILLSKFNFQLTLLNLDSSPSSKNSFHWRRWCVCFHDSRWCFRLIWLWHSPFWNGTLQPMMPSSPSTTQLSIVLQTWSSSWSIPLYQVYHCLFQQTISVERLNTISFYPASFWVVLFISITKTSAYKCLATLYFKISQTMICFANKHCHHSDCLHHHSYDAFPHRSNVSKKVSSFLPACYIPHCHTYPDC